MTSLHAYNLTEPPYEAAKCMIYFEKHNLLEISRHLLLRLGLSRTIDVQGFIKKHIKEIANEVNTKHSILIAPSAFDFNAFSEYMKKRFNIPTVVYTKQKENCKGYKIVKKFKKFLKYLKLEDKNVIFVNFPSNRIECLHFRKHHINPTYVFEIKPSFQIPFKTKKMLEDEGAPFIDKLNQVKGFYEHVARVVNFGVATGIPENATQAHECYAQTVQEIGFDIVKMLRNTETKKDEIEAGKFQPRVVILGRKGSGRRTQAKALAELFGCVFVDVQQLILDNMKGDSPIAVALRNVATSHEYSELAISNLVQKRLLEPDCLKLGWVVVGYPNSVGGFHRMAEFFVPPNKIIFLHCRERVALERLRKHWQRDPVIKEAYAQKNKCPKQDSNYLDQREISNDTLLQYIERDPSFRVKDSPAEILDHLEDLARKEFLMYNLTKNSLLAYLSDKKETIHIDGNHTRKTVTTDLCARVDQKQNDFGFVKGRCTRNTLEY